MYIDKKDKKVFTPKSVISFCNGRKLSSYLVWAKLYPEQRKTGSLKCGRTRCEVCLNVNKEQTRKFDQNKL